MSFIYVCLFICHGVDADWADDHNRGLMDNEVQGEGSSNGEIEWAISDHSHTDLQPFVPPQKIDIFERKKT